MSLPDDIRANRIAARFGRTAAIEWIQPREPEGGWTSYADFDPGETQVCLSVGRLIHDDDCVKVLAGSAMLVGDEHLWLSGIIEIPARCVVRIVRLEEEREKEPLR
jgi:hypothetical protein